MAAAPVRIGLLWHSANSGNLGVAALTVANISIARQVALELGIEPRFVIVGMRDYGVSYVDALDVSSFLIDTRSLLQPGGYWSVLRDLDCVLDIGAGDSFAGIYGPKRFGFIWLSKMMAFARRLPILLSPQTIGPFEGAYKTLAGMAMKRAEAVVARDKPSLQVIRELAPKAKAVLATDVAFALPFEDRSGERGDRRNGRIRVGVNVSGLLFTDAEAGRNRFGMQIDYAAYTRALLGALAERSDVDLHLVPHATARNLPDDDDGRIADRMAAEFPDAIRVPDFSSPSEAKSYMSSLDFMVAGRMHACIGCFSAGVPVLPVAYSRKFSGLFGSLGYDWMIPTRGMGTEQAVAFSIDALAKRDRLREQEARGMAQIEELLENYRVELRALFRKVAR